MQSKLLHEQSGMRTFAVILQSGDEVMSCLEAFANRERLGAAQLTAIGALSEARLAYFDWDSKKYLPITVGEQVEVASLVGDASMSMPCLADATGPPWRVTCSEVTFGRRSK